MTRRTFLSSVILGGVAVAVGCRNGGNISLFGYTTEPPFDPNITSVYIPTFKLAPVVASPLRGIDVDLTDAVVKELNARKTPIKVISSPGKADTELIGTIVQVDKNVLNRNPQNLPLESEIVLSVDLVWRDLRSGEILTNPKPPAPAPSPTGAFDPSIAPDPPPAPDPVPRPIRIRATGRFLTQNGESTITGATEEKTAKQTHHPPGQGPTSRSIASAAALRTSRSGSASSFSSSGSAAAAAVP
jgi:hypothetical protein